MKRLFFLLACIAASSPPAAAAAMRTVPTCRQSDSKKCDVVKVQGRTISFLPASKTDSAAQVLVNGQVAFTTRTADYVSLLAVVKLTNETVVVIDQDDGGSGTSSQFAILVVPADPKAPVAVHELPETSQGTTPTIMTDGTVVTVDLGPYDGKRRISSYRMAKLTNVEKPDGGNVPADQCRWVYGIMKSCAAMKHDGADCSASYGQLGMVAVRGFYQLGHYPRFKTEAAEAACVKACETGKAPPAASVRKSVCGL
jgi:hypothetical protein